MKKQKIFCTFCGHKIVQKMLEGKLRDYCPSCNTIFYENPLPVASCIVVNKEREVLLVKRKKDPYKDMWCLPIGFAETGEEIMEAALRELEEEAGIAGEIIRLIDVDTVDNYFYGSLAIVTYEIKKTGGDVRPGDDASEARYFPILEIPQLAWSSNEKAIKIYIELYRDTWTMLDSFRHLFPDLGTITDLSIASEGQHSLLSNILIKMIDSDINLLLKEWEDEVRKNIPGLIAHLDVCSAMNKNVLRGIQYWLQRGTDTLGVEEFVDTGRQLDRLGIEFPDMMVAMALSRKCLWTHLVRERIFSTPLEIYTTLETNNRIIFFYDKINYYLAKGYTELKGRENQEGGGYR